MVLKTAVALAGVLLSLAPAAFAAKPVDCTKKANQRKYRKLCRKVYDPIVFKKSQEIRTFDCTGEYEDGYQIGICQKVSSAEQKKIQDAIDKTP